MENAQVEPRILIVEDDPGVAEVMRLALSRQGWQALVARDGFEGVERALETDYDLILMDHRMPRVPGPEAARRILDARPDQSIAMVTGTPTDDEFRRVIEERGLYWFYKPFTPQELVEKVRGWLEDRR
jgi:DNA-binding response OmpR family regulator